MFDLNLPPADLKIRNQEGKEYVFDPLRKQYVRLTPEEFVRQRFVSYLLSHKNYPSGRLANEVQISLGNVTKRCDTILYDDFLQPLMIIEYKAPSVCINQKTFDQIARYNMSLNVPWLIISNGIQHFCCRIEKGEVIFAEEIPDSKELMNRRFLE
ncbi:type I restriction enzyme HsdR N-terminal domain-containing protein [Bacteroidales bacterium OttesenSCG-928-A17]|nr:type I restriction enzyme HsdR N-terminal domain-containing protein [Bacteroidales bacterium OttesenSCG-928-A17]